MPKIRSDLLALVLFCASLLLLAFAYGVAVGRFEIFPYTVITDAVSSAKAMRTYIMDMRGKIIHSCMNDILGSQCIGKVRKGARLIGAATVHGAEAELERPMNEANRLRAVRASVG